MVIFGRNYNHSKTNSQFKGREKKTETKSERNEKNEDSGREGIEGNGRAEM